ncbi:MAG: 3-keto-5-aminohexanoate cleavage enzyme [Candidatus Endobugula sp.]|jgi:3-keto-5-aminohexanoate cleavage enzyme
MSENSSFPAIMLPTIMVAPNGARRGKNDHAQLPMVLPEIIHTAQSCWQAGAGGLHLHVRGAQGEHVLDAGLYKEAIVELKNVVPDMLVQITTEAVGVYLPPAQRQVVKDVRPEAASVSIAEMLVENDRKAAMNFYRWCEEAGIVIQHILYSEDDMARLYILLGEARVNLNGQQLLFVLGRYAKGQQSQPSDLQPFTHWLQVNEITADWAVCAFGQNETTCLRAAYFAGGKVRIGFENSLQNADGSFAADNAERVAEIKRLINMPDAE